MTDPETGAPPDRVADHSSAGVNRALRAQTDQRVRALAADPAGIERRLAALEREWDVERALEATASSFVLAGLTLAAARSPRWLLFPGVVATFLLQHAVQGWCPPLPVFRRLGFRTAEEIARERSALKALRGDFDAVNGAGTAEARARRALEASGG